MLRGMMMDRPLLVSSVIDYAAEIFPDVRGGLADRRRRPAPLRLRSGARTHRPPCQRPGRARHQARRPRGDAGLERLPPLRALLRDLRHRRRLPHHQPAPVPRADHLHRQPRRGHARCSSTSTFLPLVEKLAPALKSVRTYVAMTDREHMPPASSLPGLLCYESLLAEMPADIDLARVRRERRLRALLHVRHHRRAEGRALLQPVDAAAHVLDHRLAATHLRAQPHDPARGAAVPRQRLGPALHHAADRLPHRPARRQARRPEPVRSDGERGRRCRLGRAHRLARPDRRVQEARTQAEEPDADPDRRLGHAAGHDRHAVARLRHRGGARLGHDRDEPDRHAHHPAPRGARHAAARSRRAGRQAGPPPVRGGAQDHRREGQPRRAREQHARRAVRARPDHRLGLLQERRTPPPSRSTARAGLPPATSPRSGPAAG